MARYVKSPAELLAVPADQLPQIFCNSLDKIFSFALGDIQKELVKLPIAQLKAIRILLGEWCVHKFQALKDKVLKRRTATNKIVDDILSLSGSLVNKSPHADLMSVFQNTTKDNEQDEESVTLPALLKLVVSLRDRVHNLESELKELKRSHNHPDIAPLESIHGGDEDDT